MIKRRRELRKQAFSLIEVLLILALVGVLMGVVAGNASAFIKGSNYEPPGRVLKVATLDAVYFSSERKRKSSLRALSVCKRERESALCVRERELSLFVRER